MNVFGGAAFEEAVFGGRDIKWTSLWDDVNETDSFGYCTRSCILCRATFCLKRCMFQNSSRYGSVHPSSVHVVEQRASAASPSSR